MAFAGIMCILQFSNETETHLVENENSIGKRLCKYLWLKAEIFWILKIDGNVIQFQR